MGSAYSRPGERNKTHAHKPPNDSPNSCDGKESWSPTSSNPCCPIFRNSKAQAADNTPYPRLSIYRKAPRPPPKPSPPPLPAQSTNNPVRKQFHSQVTPRPLTYIYDRIKRPHSQPHSRPEQGPKIPRHGQETPRPLSYVYDGLVQSVQGDTMARRLDPSPTPHPSTYLYDGLKQRQSQPPDRGEAVPRFGEWDSDNLSPPHSNA